jgi:hypothetical protein
MGVTLSLQYHDIDNCFFPFPFDNLAASMRVVVLREADCFRAGHLDDRRKVLDLGFHLTIGSHLEHWNAQGCAFNWMLGGASLLHLSSWIMVMTGVLCAFLQVF